MILPNQKMDQIADMPAIICQTPEICMIRFPGYSLVLDPLPLYFNTSEGLTPSFFIGFVLLI